MLGVHDVCLWCAAVVEPSPQLERRIAKVEFNQRKFLEGLVPEVRRAIGSDELLLAVVYGFEDYHVLTARRLIACGIETNGHVADQVIRGVLSWATGVSPSSGGPMFGTQSLTGPKKILGLESITRITDWSNLWWPFDDVRNYPAFMTAQITTFSCELNVSAANEEVAGFHFADPYHLSTQLREACGHIEQGLSLYDDALLRIAQQQRHGLLSRSTSQSESNDGSPWAPPAAEEPPVDLNLPKSDADFLASLGLEKPAAKQTTERIRVRCSCGAKLAVKSSLHGKSLRCPKCRELVHE
jgi:hypothetical protein